MRAKPGDWLVVGGHRVGEAERKAEILKVRGENGSPPYYVRWADDRESLVYPGADTTVERHHKANKSTSYLTASPGDEAEASAQSAIGDCGR